MKRDEREFYGRAGDDPQAAPHACERADELVAYLYDEADADSRRRFELHARDCAACREELAAFRGVRRAVAAWRVEALSDVPAVAAVHADAARRKPSALAALREFFALSPAWLRAAWAASAVAVIALAALTLARAELNWGDGGLALRFGVTERVVERRVEVPAPAEGFTREQVDEIADARVASALAEYRAKAERQVVKASGDKDADARAESHQTGATTRAKRRARPAQPARRTGPMLADSDDGLPRLSDILSVAN